MTKRNGWILSTAAALVCLFLCGTGYAIDADVTRHTLKGLEGVYVVVENLQPNLLKYARKNGFYGDQLEGDVKAKLQKAGIKVLSRDQWLKTPGTPFLYLRINTHEYEKYWFAYDIRVELRQLATLESNPTVKTLAATWSVNMTGVANVGTLNSIRENGAKMIDRFTEAYAAENRPVK